MKVDDGPHDGEAETVAHAIRWFLGERFEDHLAVVGRHARTMIADDYLAFRSDNDVYLIPGFTERNGVVDQITKSDVQQTLIALDDYAPTSSNRHGHRVAPCCAR